MKKGLKITLAAVFTAAAVFFISALPDETPYEKPSKIMAASDGELLSYTLSEDGYLRFDTKVSEVDPLYLKMLIASEDKRFYSHPGVDPLAMGRALISDIKARKVVSGGSTLAMQTARTMAKNPRTLLNKARETLAALCLTFRHGREGVLNRYLSLAPMGSNIEGVKAASYRWFGHAPSHLTPAEAALLVALPRAPELIRPDRHPESALYYRNDVLRLATENGVIKEDVGEAAALEPLPKALVPLKRSAPQLQAMLSKQGGGYYAATTLKSATQKVLSNIGENFHQRHKQDGLTAAIIVINNETMELEGYLGAAVNEDSFLNLPYAVRSPGSALKPFAYALAFSQNLLHPKTILEDSKRSYGAWTPRNFTGSFRGEITAEKALIQSLNLPALKVLESLDAGLFLSELNLGKRRVILPPGEKAQLSLILGGCGISLMHLTELYAALANDGKFQDAVILKDGEREAPAKADYEILDKNSARAVYEILKATPRPYEYTRGIEVSYKTGTSFRGRDAFAVGSYGTLTCGVWVGRPDGHAVPGNTGFLNAAPLLFETLSKLPKGPKAKPELNEEGPLAPRPPKALASLKDTEGLLPDENALFILFPGDGQTVVPDSEGFVTLKIKGGTEPFFLTVNGAQQEGLRFKAEKSGYYQLTLLDGEGRSQNLTLKILTQ